MKKLLALLVILTTTLTSWGQFGVFNHVGADLSVSTTGIGVELSTPITDFVQMRAGVSFMPKFSFKANADGTVKISDGQGFSHDEPFDITIEGNTKRTQGDIIFNIYPFGRMNSLFVAAGAYFGGKSVISLKGHSDRVAEFQADGTLQAGWVKIGDYNVAFEEQGNVYGGLVAKNFRPYLGLGYGRPCPKGRVGFMVELGVQFMGHMKVCQGRDLQAIDISGIDSTENDDWQKWMDKLAVYPVLKFTLSGRLF